MGIAAEKNCIDPRRKKCISYVVAAIAAAQLYKLLKKIFSTRLNNGHNFYGIVWDAALTLGRRRMR
jgi:hypothetical protein